MATVPPRPTLLSATALSSSTIRVIFEGNGDGGSVILAWQIGYGTNPTTPQGLVDSDGNTVLGGFSPGQRIYFWARGRNAIGWGPWSNRGSAVTWKVPNAPQPVITRGETQTTVVASFVDGYDGGTPIIEWQIGYGLNAEGPDLFVNDTFHIASFILTNLEPGGTYYFWARTRNVVGWSAWSARSQKNLIAGARVRVGYQMLRAVPYVRVGGVWKVARPWVKSGAAWRETSI